LSPIVNRLLLKFFDGFNWVFERLTEIYGWLVAQLLRVSVFALVVYVGLIGLTVIGFKAVPVGFIPEQDKGYLVLNAQLPEGAVLDRTDHLIRELSALAREDKGVDHTIDLPGYSAVLGTNLGNVGGMFIILKPFNERAGDPELSADKIVGRLRKRFAQFTEAQVAVFGAPPIDGLGTT